MVWHLNSAPEEIGTEGFWCEWNDKFFICGHWHYFELLNCFGRLLFGLCLWTHQTRQVQNGVTLGKCSIIRLKLQENRLPTFVFLKNRFQSECLEHIKEVSCVHLEQNKMLTLVLFQLFSFLIPTLQKLTDPPQSGRRNLSIFCRLDSALIYIWHIKAYKIYNWIYYNFWQLSFCFWWWKNQDLETGKPCHISNLKTQCLRKRGGVDFGCNWG